MTRLFNNLVIVVLVLTLSGLTPAVLHIPVAGAQTAPTAPRPAPLKKDFSAEIRPEDFTGALDIRIHAEAGKLKPPAELLLKDPQGRKIGLDPRLDKTYREIPHAFYEFEGIADAVSGAPGPESGIIDVRNPVDGSYTLEIIGKKSGYYTIEITGYDENLEPSKILLKKAKITQGSSRTFSFTYSHEPGKRSVTPEKPAELRKK
jgi:hypothetical protein